MIESQSSAIPGVLLDRSRRYRRYLVDLAIRRSMAPPSDPRRSGSARTDSLCLARLVLAVDHELQSLAKSDPPLASLVELAFFFGCSLDEAARQTGRNKEDLQGEWSFAQAWLRRCATHAA